MSHGLSDSIRDSAIHPISNHQRQEKNKPQTVKIVYF
jgi:hypothetical protein